MSQERVELRFAPVSRGVDSPPKTIEQLEKRARSMAELRRYAPSKRFSKFLGEIKRERQDRGLEDEGRPPPKLGLLHPAHRALYGRESTNNEVILKG